MLFNFISVLISLSITINVQKAQETHIVKLDES